MASPLSTVLSGANDALSSPTGSPLPAGDGGPMVPAPSSSTGGSFAITDGGPIVDARKPVAPMVRPPAPKDEPEPAPVQKTDDTAKRIAFPSGAVLDTPGNWGKDLVDTVSRKLHELTSTMSKPASSANVALTEGGPIVPLVPKPKADDNKRIAFPSGMVLQVPDWGSKEIDTLARELHSAVETVIGLPGSVYHSMADKETPEEIERYGKGGMAKAGPLGRLIARAGVTPTEVAIEDYAHGRVSPEAALSVAPEALGSAGGVTVGGKLIDTLKGGPKTSVKPTETPVKAPTEAPAPAKPATQLTPTEQTAAAYLRKIRANAPQVEEANSPVSGDVESDLPGQKGPVAKGEVLSPEEANKLAKDYTDKLSKEGSGPDAKPKISFDTHDGDVMTRHRASLNQGAIERGHVEAIEDPSQPGTWRVNSSDIDTDLRGQGYGVQLYKELIKQAYANGADKIVSDAVTSPEAKRIYGSLAKSFDVQTQKLPGGGTRYTIPVMEETPTANATTPEQIRSAVQNATKTEGGPNKNISLNAARAKVIKQSMEPDYTANQKGGGMDDEYNSPIPKNLKGEAKLRWLNENMTDESKLAVAKHELGHWDYSRLAGHPAEDMGMTIGHDSVGRGQFSTGQTLVSDSFWKNFMKQAKTPEARSDAANTYLKHLLAPTVIEEMQGTTPERTAEVTANDHAQANDFIKKQMDVDDPDEMDSIREGVLDQLRKEITPKKMKVYDAAAKQIVKHHYGEWVSPFAVDHYLSGGTHEAISPRLAEENAPLGEYAPEFNFQHLPDLGTILGRKK